MFKLLKGHARRLLTLSICCASAATFTLAPLPLTSARSDAPAATTARYYGYYDTYYSDATYSDIVGEYNSCTGVLVGQRTPYKYTETIICG